MADLNYNYTVNTQVYERKVVYTCKCNIIDAPSNKLNYGWYWAGTNGNYQWVSADKNPVFTIADGFSPGRTYDTKVRCDVSCDYTYIGADGKPVSDTIYVKGRAVDMKIYTHPGPFHFNASKNNIITNVLTKEKITDWLNHYKKGFHWFYQSTDNDNYLANLTTTVNNSLNKGIVTAEWYNACARAMGEIGKNYYTVEGGADGTVIYAWYINALDFDGMGE